MLSWFRRNRALLLTGSCLIGVFGATIYMVNQTPEPSSFEVRAADCKEQFVGVTTEKSRDICSVTIDRTLYPYVSGTGSSCLDIDLTRAENFKPETHKWVIRLKSAATFSFIPVRTATTDPEHSTEFKGTVKDQWGEGEVSCGMLPAK